MPGKGARERAKKRYIRKRRFFEYDYWSEREVTRREENWRLFLSDRQRYKQLYDKRRMGRTQGQERVGVPGPHITDSELEEFEFLARSLRVRSARFEKQRARELTHMLVVADVEEARQRFHSADNTNEQRAIAQRDLWDALVRQSAA